MSSTIANLREMLPLLFISPMKKNHARLVKRLWWKVRIFIFLT